LGRSDVIGKGSRLGKGGYCRKLRISLGIKVGILEFALELALDL
jgi:hypothetical protein